MSGLIDGMMQFLTKRVFVLVIVLFITSFSVFQLIHIAPGDPIQLIYGMRPENYDPDTIDMLRSQYGLDKPVLIQYGHYVKQLLSGNMGTSIRDGRDVFDTIITKLPNTIILSVSSLVLSLCIAIPLGIHAALRQNRFLDHLYRLVSVLSISIPSFFLGILLIYIFSVKLHWLPSSGSGGLGSGVGNYLIHLLMPMFVLGLSLSGSTLRLMRASMIEVLQLDYIRTAYSKGLSSNYIIRRHALRNAIFPVVTHVGLQFGELIGGSVIIESVFSWPGIGLLMLNSILRREYPIILGCTLFLITTFVFINTLVDILYYYMNPRIRY